MKKIMRNQAKIRKVLTRVDKGIEPKGNPNIDLLTVAKHFNEKHNEEMRAKAIPRPIISRKVMVALGLIRRVK